LSTTPENVALSIDQKTWAFWDTVELTLALDNFSTCTFTAPFESERTLFRETFQPFSYKSLNVKVDGADLFTGQLVGVEPKVTADSKSVLCNGYSLPAQLSDIHAPSSAFPLEFNGLTLRQIADQLAQPFGLRVEFEAPDGASFRRVALKPEDSVRNFLAELARQRSLVISDSPTGALVFLQSIASGVPVVQLQQGEPPLESVAATFSPQAYYSEITGLSKTKASREGSKYTVQNTRLSGVTRPLTFTAQDVRPPDLPTAVQAKMARMFGNMVSYVVSLPTWRDPQGSLFTPNTLVTLEAPDAMIYNKTTLLVRDVILRQDKESTTASLGLVLPGAFNGVLPTVLPWD